MLKIFRHKNVTKVVLWGLLILILPAFILWGTGSGGRSKDSGPAFVGLIDGKRITFNDFAESIASIKCQIILNYFNQPKVMDAFLKSKAFLGKLAWDRLIMARKANIKVSNIEVVNFIRSLPLFLRGGSFDDRMYSYILRNSMGLEPRMFEEMIRGNLEIQKFNDRLTKDIKATDQEIAEAYGKANDKLKISYLDFASDSFTDKTRVEESQIQDYYKEHQKELVLPAKEGEKNNAPGIMAGFDDVKADIKKFLTGKEARELAVKAAGEQYGKLKDLMTKENLNFEAAAAKLALNVKESAFFSRSEKPEGIGEAGALTEAAGSLKPDEISAPFETEKGVIIFKVSGSQKFDEEKFKKEKDNYLKKTVELKKTQYIETWLRSLEKASKVNIDFEDYEKYYR